MKYQKFIFRDYRFDDSSKQLTLRYGFDEVLSFTETFRFDFDFAEYDSLSLDRAFQMLFLMAGVSYFKTYLAPEIVIQNAAVDQALADFLGTAYQRGLGEFFYVNQLDPKQKVTFPTTSPEPLQPSTVNGDGLLVGIGGGKDSLVSVEMLRSQPKVATWSLNHRQQLQPLVERIGLPHFFVERQWDKQLLELNQQDAYNGHVPISAIIACVGTIVSILTGYNNQLVSNESSANEPTLEYQGVAINHQYSKSLEFETDYQHQLQRLLLGVNYFSFLRPLSEVHIAALFAKLGFAKYHDVFSSCNRAFRHDSDHLYWDGSCPKCAFVFLALTPFVPRNQLEALFSGKNLLLDPQLDSTYRQLLGIEGDKPLECVGEVKESRAAMHLSQEPYPELVKYQFDLPVDYNYKQLAQHALPDSLFKILESNLHN